MTWRTQPGRALLMLGALAGLSVMLSACNTTQEVVTDAIPSDYRQRHPIALQEAHDRSVEIFIGRDRGNLTDTQRADVVQLARTWFKDGTGAIVIDVPVDTPNARAAASVAHEARSLLETVGVPAHGITTRSYQPTDPRTLATVSLSYPRIAATAGPCGLWPEDLGPNILDPSYRENRDYYNFGCANQRNLAAMVDNPSDLVQPRPETPPYTARRSAAFEKYRKGESPAPPADSEAEKAKISDTAK